MPFKMNQIATFVISLFILSGNLAYSAPLQPAEFPKALMYLGKPIDASCFGNTDSAHNNHIYDLRKCSTSDPDRIDLKNDFMNQKGFYGFNHAYQPTSAYEGNKSSYAFYKAWPADTNRYWVLSLVNTGGSGDFSAIDLVTRIDTNTIKIEPVDGGDRCNGGIDPDAPELTSDGLKYMRYMSPSDFLSFKDANPHYLHPYKDLEACAVCCTAKIAYTVNTKLQNKFEFIELTSEKTHQTLTEDKNYQNCFNKVKASWIKNGRGTLTDWQAVSHFMREFNQLCVEKNH